MVLHTIVATQQVPRHTRLHSRGSTRVPPTSRGAPFPPPSSRGGILSLRGLERIPGVPVASQEEALSTERREELQDRATIPRVPQMSQFIPGKPVSLHCLDFQDEHPLTPRWHVRPPLGNPRGKATDPLIHPKGTMTLLLQLGRKAHVHAPTRDKD